MNQKDRRYDEERKKFFKEAVKEAMKEWLDEKAQCFGRWGIMTILAAALVALIYFILTMSGWQPPNLQHK